MTTKNSKEFLSSTDKILSEQQAHAATLARKQELLASGQEQAAKDAYAAIPLMIAEFISKSSELGVKPNGEVSRKNALWDWAFPMYPRFESVWMVPLAEVRATLIAIRSNGRVYYLWKGGTPVDTGYGWETPYVWSRLRTYADYQHAFFLYEPRNIRKCIQHFRDGLDQALRGKLAAIKKDVQFHGY